MGRNIDLEHKLPIYLPGLLELLNGKTFKARQWRAINNSLKGELNRRKALLENGQSIKVATNIYDVIVGVIEGKMSPFTYYQYLLILFLRLTKNLDEVERNKLRHTLYSVFIEVDHNYRNFIGE